MENAFELVGRKFKSRLLLGTARYPSLKIMEETITASGAEMVTVSLRRESLGASPEGNSFWRRIASLGVAVLPNTAGCRTAKEAVTTAKLARELFETSWVKLEVIGDEGTLQPDPFGLVEAARELSKAGFEVFPYTTEDVVVAERLVEVGCSVLMPWGSPIGTGQGLQNPRGLQTLRARFPKIPIVVDAGLGRPSHAAAAMELGVDAVLLNTAVALAGDPPRMGKAFAMAVKSGREAYLAGMMAPRDIAAPSTPRMGTPFWHATSRGEP